MIGIYKITSPSGKIYIGQSVDLEKRFNTYKRLECKKQSRLYNSLKKYGIESHLLEIICQCEIHELNDKERYYQDTFKVTGKSGLNCILTKSSDKNGSHSEESKRKISESNKGKKHSEKYKQNCRKRQLGKKHSDETRLRMSEARKGKANNLGRKFSEGARSNISEGAKKIILNTQTGIYYNGLKEASSSISIKESTLKNYLNGYRINKTNLIYT